MLSRMSRTTARCVSTRSEIDARELAEVRRDAVRHDREHRDAERLGGLGGDALGENAVDGEPEMAVLLGAAERKHGAVVVLQVLLDLHPVHVADAQLTGSRIGGQGFETSDEMLTQDMICHGHVPLRGGPVTLAPAAKRIFSPSHAQTFFPNLPSIDYALPRFVPVPRAPTYGSPLAWLSAAIAACAPNSGAHYSPATGMPTWREGRQPFRALRDGAGWRSHISPPVTRLRQDPSGGALANHCSRLRRSRSGRLGHLERRFQPSDRRGLARRHAHGRAATGRQALWAPHPPRAPVTPFVVEQVTRCGRAPFPTRSTPSPRTRSSS